MDRAIAYEMAAEWHDIRAKQCRDIARNDTRLDSASIDRAKIASAHHAASAAGLRSAAINIRRLAVTSP